MGQAEIRRTAGGCRSCFWRSQMETRPVLTLFPTLCDVCYDPEAADSLSGECQQPFRLSRTTTPSMGLANSPLNPFLSHPPTNGHPLLTPDFLHGRHSVAGAAPQLLAPSPSHQQRSRTTIGNYSDAPAEKISCASNHANIFSVPANDRMWYRSHTEGRLMAVSRFFGDVEDFEEDEKLVWAESLKKWIAADSENLPYFSFVNTAHLTARKSPRMLHPRDRSTTSLDSELFTSSHASLDPDKRTWRLRRGFVPPKPKPKPPTQFISMKARKPSKPKSAHRVTFVDPDVASGDTNSDAGDSFLDGILSQKDSLLDLGSESRISGSESEKTNGDRDTEQEEEKDEGIDAASFLLRDPSASDMEREASGAGSADPAPEVQSPDLTFSLQEPSDNSPAAVAGEALNVLQATCPVESEAAPPPVAQVGRHGNVEKSARSKRSVKKTRRGHETESFGKRAAARYMRKKKGQGGSERENKEKEEEGPVLQVTKEIASVRLEEAPNLSLVADPQAKNQIRGRPGPNLRPRVVPSRKKISPFATKEPPKPPRKTVGWLFAEEATAAEVAEKPAEIEAPRTYSIPPLPEPPAPLSPPKTPSPEPPVFDKALPLLHQRRRPKPRWGPRRRDQTYMSELRDAERREKARQLATRLFKRERERRGGDCGVKDAPRFEQYGFLSKYCILNRASVEMYRSTFDAVDDEQKGWLSYEETLIGLRGVNPRLRDAEEKYLYRVLELCGYNVRRGADFKLFAVLAAMSQKITSLDSWMRNIIGRMDFKMLEMKMFMCKHLWECNVDHDTNCIPIDQLCVELRAGGVTEPHVDEVRQRLGWLKALDLMDFLTYIPLFIVLHTSIVENPLDMSRTI